MTDKKQEKINPLSMFTEWMKTATAYWSSMADVWTEAAEETTTKKDDGKSRDRDSWEQDRNLWQVLFEIMRKPEALEALFKSTETLPQMLAKLGQANLNSFLYFQKQWMQKTADIEEPMSVYPFERVDKDFFKNWNQIYEKEFRKFFQIPQVGPARSYQEKVNRAVDKLNLFQADMAEFFYLLYLPLETSFRIIQEELAQLVDEGQTLEDSQDYYKMWVKILEEHYMTLFKSSDYTQTLAKALNSMADFSAARQEILGDIMAMFSLPTPKDMDAIYKEIYVLKKRIKKLEKEKSELNRGTK